MKRTTLVFGLLLLASCFSGSNVEAAAAAPDMHAADDGQGDVHWRDYTLDGFTWAGITQQKFLNAVESGNRERIFKLFSECVFIAVIIAIGGKCGQ